MIDTEFNEHQREVFCVFSGSGVTRLRIYLNSPKIPAPGETNMAYYNEDDDEQEMEEYVDNEAGTDGVED